MRFSINEPSYLIIGCGHFGTQATEKLLRKDPHSKITIVDKNEKAFKQVSHLPIEILLDLMEGIKRRRDPNRIILISTACRYHGFTSALSF
jgi:FlaA1/EpsC-like NDP-sugar epimerase